MATYHGRFKMAQNTAAGWTSDNPVLLSGEIGLETDTGFIKIGNGATAWNSLGYAVVVLTGAQTIAGVKTFSSSPLVPTASPGDNTTKAASTAFVAAALAALLDSAPGALDTLNELAAALGDDSNYAATITAALALKAPLASPGLTGTPTAPTAAGGTNTTQLATTAFVQSELSAGGFGDMSKSTYDTDDDGKVNSAEDSDALGGVAANLYALKTYVDSAIANLINSAPGALDTLDELAAALGDDANFASTVTTALAGKQSTISGASLTAVTVAANDKVLIQDTSDSNNLKTVTAQSIADLAGSPTLAQGKLAGRGASSGSGSPEEITLGTGLSMSGTTLNASGGSGVDYGKSYALASGLALQ